MIRRRTGRERAETDAERKEKRPIPFFPNYLLDEVIAWYTALALLIILASLLPAGLEEQADALRTPAHIKPEWYFLFLFQFLKLVPRVVGVLAPGVLVALLFLLPFLDRSPRRSPRARPVTMAVTIVLLAAIIVLTIWAWQS